MGKARRLGSYFRACHSLAAGSGRKPLPYQGLSFLISKITDKNINLTKSPSSHQPDPCIPESNKEWRQGALGKLSRLPDVKTHVSSQCGSACSRSTFAAPCISHSLIYLSITSSSACGLTSFRGQREKLDLTPDGQRDPKPLGDAQGKEGSQRGSSGASEWSLKGQGASKDSNVGEGFLAKDPACPRADCSTVVGCASLVAAWGTGYRGADHTAGLVSQAKFRRWAFTGVLGSSTQFLGWLHFCGPARPSRRWPEGPGQAESRGR